MWGVLKARKEGCVLLIVASVLMIGWMRSLAMSDEFVRFQQWRGNDVTTGFYRSNDQSIRYIWRHASNGNVRENQAWSIHYAIITMPTALLAAYLILWPFSRPLSIEAWLVVFITSATLALICL